MSVIQNLGERYARVKAAMSRTPLPSQTAQDICQAEEIAIADEARANGFTMSDVFAAANKRVAS